MNTILAAAIDYAERGHRVFPVRLIRRGSGWTKCPALSSPKNGGQRNPNPAAWQDPSKGGFHQGSRDRHEVAAMWFQCEGGSIGYAPPPRVVIIDIDGEENLKKITTDYPELCRGLVDSDTFVVSTPGHKGWHYYFLAPKGVPIGQTQNSLSGIGSLVDTRVGGRGLTLLPPSGHGGGNYTVERGTLDDLAPLPPEWIEELRTTSLVRPRLSNHKKTKVCLAPSSYHSGGGILSMPPKNPSGGKWPTGTGRHTMLFPRASAMQSAGWPIARSKAQILEWNRTLWEEPKDEGLLSDMVEDVYGRY